MKKIRITAMALLMFCLLSILPYEPVYATEQETENAPVFMVMAVSGEETFAMTAFYVEDTHGTGSTYLVTSSIVGNLKENGYKIYIGKEGYAKEIETLHTEDRITYLQAEDLAGTVALTMTEDVITYNPAAVYLKTSNGSDFTMKAVPLDLENWATAEGYYFQGEAMENITYLGAPVLDATSTTVMGMLHVDEDNETVMIDLTQYDFPEEAAIVVGDKEPEREDVAAEPVDETDIMIGVISAVVVVLVIAYFVQKNKKENKGKKKGRK